MGTPRKRHSSEFKARIALEAIKEDRTLAQLSSEFGVSPVQISQWKKLLLEGAASLYSRKKGTADPEEVASSLYQEIGRLKMELDWLKKKCAPFSRRETGAD